MTLVFLAQDVSSISRLLCDLKQCTRSRDLRQGKRLHSEIMHTGFMTNTYVLNSLIHMYAKCDDMVHAKQVFDNAPARNLIAWNCLIWGYVTNGENEIALETFNVMLRSGGGCFPSPRTLVAALVACSNLGIEKTSFRGNWLARGKELHSLAVEMRLCDMFVENTLVDMYIKCGSMKEARLLFERMKHRDVVSWTVLLQGYVELKEFELVLVLFDCMIKEASPDARTYVVLLTACASLADERPESRKTVLSKTRELHSQALKSFTGDIFVGTNLINVYAKCGSMVEARKVFDKMPFRNVVSWTALMHGYVENGQPEEALHLFETMESAPGGCQPNCRTFLVAITACAAEAKSGKQKPPLLNLARSIHSRAVDNRCCSLPLGNALVDMYGQYGSMPEARRVFDCMSHRDVITWTCLIRGYMLNGESLLAVEVFDSMERLSVLPNGMTYVAVLAAFSVLVKVKASRAWLTRAEAVYHRAVATGCCDVFVRTTMLDVYAKAGGMPSARAVFESMRERTVVTWNSLLQGYVEGGEYQLVLEVFDRMETSSDGCSPDARSYVCALTACGRLAKLTSGKDQRWLERGKEIHSRAVEHRWCDTFVQSALVDLYSSFGHMNLASDVFNNMASPDVVSWNCLIQGYADNRQPEFALGLFVKMKARNVLPTSATFLAALGACGSLMDVERGEALHAEIRERGLDQDEMVASSLMDFYGKCGKLDAAGEVFRCLGRKDVTAWNSLMSGHARRGDVEEVVGLFDEMRKHGLTADSVTFTHLLNACSHAGDTSKGQEVFESMERRFGVKPDLIHFNCIIDLLGRANHLDEALEMVRSMPMEPNEVTWTSMLAACRKWNNTAIGALCYQSFQKQSTNVKKNNY